MATATHLDRSARLRDPSYQAFLLLRTVFTVAPILFGLDKFANLMSDWPMYLAPWIDGIVPGDAATAMYIVGVIEIAAGVLVAVAPRIGAYVVALWLAGIIVNLAGLRGIPTELYDAARIDGAGWWAQLRNVTLPMMSPVIFYALILGLVDVLQYFLVPLVLYNGTGEPQGTTLFFNLYLYKQFFTFQNMSYGSTLAWLLFLITLAITLVLFRTSRRWVYYAAER